MLDKGILHRLMVIKNCRKKELVEYSVVNHQLAVIHLLSALLTLQEVHSKSVLDHDNMGLISLRHSLKTELIEDLFFVEEFLLMSIVFVHHSKFSHKECFQLPSSSKFTSEIINMNIKD